MTQLTLPVSSETVHLVSQALSEWRTVPEVRDFVLMNGGPWLMETTISARIRDLRKTQFGALEVNKRTRKGNLYEYRRPACDRTS